MKSLDFLKDTNDWLEQYPINIGEAFDNFVGKGQNIAQDKVDTFCIWLAWKVNISIERKRQELIKALYNMYKTTAGGRVLKTAMAVKDFANDPLDAIGKFAGAIFSPINSVISWVKVLAKELPRLAKNLAYIAMSLPPSPPNPHINYNKFRLKIGSINMSTITQDPDKLPSPESMFPEPAKPWSPESFQKEFESAEVQKKYFYNVDEDYSIESAIRKYTDVNSN